MLKYRATVSTSEGILTTHPIVSESCWIRSGTFSGLHLILNRAAVNPRILGRWETIDENKHGSLDQLCIAKI
jgi:hypothetical protein